MSMFMIYSLEDVDDEAFEVSNEDDAAKIVCLDQEPEEHQHEELARELDQFADELNDFLSCLGDTGPSLIDGAVPKQKKSVDFTSVAGSDDIEAKTTDDNTELSSCPAEVFSKRTKKAVAQHVQRLALRKQRRGSSGKQAILDYTRQLRAGAKEERAAGARVTWSKFQSTSFQQHITRQKFARRRVQQIQEAQRLVESARLRGGIGAPHHRSSKSGKPKSDKQATYLDQFKPTSVPPSEFDPRYLCSVYLYGLRRLGTTFITFSSLAKLEQRVRARFGIHEVVSIYREVTELILPENASSLHRSKRHRLKRLQRVSSLEHVNDGDTLCITQNAYDDMTILCDWMKKRQQVLHGFQHQAPRSSSVISTTASKEVPPPKPNPRISAAAKPQLWDSNGRSIGVKTQHAI